MSDWLEGLKAGDVVVVGGYGMSLATVDRLTPTLIIVGHAKYRRRDGVRIGESGGYHRVRLLEATPQHRLTIKREDVKDMLRHTNWNTMPDETLFEVADRVEQAVEVLKAARAK